MIDIGGPALLRAAAKNARDVVPVGRPEDYQLVLDELRASGGVSPATRRALAHRAFATTAAYDAAIAAYLGRDEPFPETLALAFERNLELAYGENPHQRRRTTRSEVAACTSSPGSSSATASRSPSTTSTTSRPGGS